MSADDYLAPKLYRQIAGFAKVTDFFGYWPSFHDSEILSLLLERAGRLERYESPVVTMRLSTREWRHDPITGITAAQRRALVDFRFAAVEEFHLAGFEYQNAIHSLELQPLPGNSPPGRWRVSFQPGSGVAGNFQSTVAVLDVAPVPLPDPYLPVTP